MWSPGLSDTTAFAPCPKVVRVHAFQRRNGSEDYVPDLFGRRELKRLMRSGSSSILVQIQEDHQNEYQNRHSHIYKEFPDVLVNEIPPGEVSILPPVKLTIYPDSQPSYQQPYKLSLQQRRMVEEEVRRLLWHGYVQPSTSPWGSPVIFVPKKNGEMRMCIDYRILNTALVTERYPIPSISLYLEKAARYKYYSLIDLKEGYHQLRLAAESRELTAFSTESGHYEFTTLPFGLSTAPMAFQRAMNSIFPSSIYPWVQVYLDDILIMANTLTEAKSRLWTVLTILRHHNIRANIRKSQLLRNRIHYLGHTVQKGSVRMEPSKVHAILRKQYPTSITELRSFLGSCNYYRNYIPMYATLAAPLYPLTGKRVLPIPTEDQLAAFNRLRDAFRKLPQTYEQPEDHAVQLRLFSDASPDGVGAVLETRDGKPIGYYSHAFSKPKNTILFMKKRCSRSYQQRNTGGTASSEQKQYIMWIIEPCRS